VLLRFSYLFAWKRATREVCGGRQGWYVCGTHAHAKPVGKNGVWEERRAVLVEGLRGLRPDLIAFQEAIVGDGYDQECDLYPVCVDASSRK
jgi:hypothetical protein